MKKTLIISFILTAFLFSACGKSKQELMTGEWEIKVPKKPNFISSLKLNADHTGILVRPHVLLDVKEIPVKWTLEGKKLIFGFMDNEGKEVSGDTLELLDVNLKSMNIRKGVTEDVLVRIK